MTSRIDEQPTNPSLQPILDVIANWTKRYPYTAGLRDELARCAPEKVARERSWGQSRRVAQSSKGSHAADRLPQLLLALGIDPKKLASDNPAKMRDLQRLCNTCTNKSRCDHELAAGTAAQHYRSYCLNAIRRFFVVWAV